MEIGDKFKITDQGKSHIYQVIKILDWDCVYIIPEEHYNYLKSNFSDFQIEDYISTGELPVYELNYKGTWQINEQKNFVIELLNKKWKPNWSINNILVVIVHLGSWKSHYFYRLIKKISPENYKAIQLETISLEVIQKQAHFNQGENMIVPDLDRPNTGPEINLKWIPEQQAFGAETWYGENHYITNELYNPKKEYVDIWYG